MDQIERTGQIRENYGCLLLRSRPRQSYEIARYGGEAIRGSSDIWRDVPYAHITAHFQIAFAHDQFPTLIPILMVNCMRDHVGTSISGRLQMIIQSAPFGWRKFAGEHWVSSGD
jgi:hypothetical protein